MIKNIEDIIPTDDRLITIRLKGTLPITIINTYPPQADRPNEEKDKAYNNLQEEIRRYHKKGPTYIGGDFNARLRTANNEIEEQIIGKNTFEPKNGEQVEDMSENVQNNRERLIELCQEFELRPMNTYFQKTKEKIATYRKVGVTKTDTITYKTHEQIDYILTTNRWKNTVQNAEADNEANIDTDHNPVIAKIRIKLKGRTKPSKQRKNTKNATKKTERQ